MVARTGKKTCLLREYAKRMLRCNTIPAGKIDHSQNKTVGLFYWPQCGKCCNGENQSSEDEKKHPGREAEEAKGDRSQDEEDIRHHPLIGSRQQHRPAGHRIDLDPINAQTYVRAQMTRRRPALRNDEIDVESAALRHFLWDDRPDACPRIRVLGKNEIIDKNVVDAHPYSSAESKTVASNPDSQR